MIIYDFSRLGIALKGNSSPKLSNTGIVLRYQHVFPSATSTLINNLFALGTKLAHLLHSKLELYRKTMGLPDSLPICTFRKFVAQLRFTS